MITPGAPEPTSSWRLALAIFAVVLSTYAATSAGFLVAPSPHFHFVDMAQSFLDGRLDTDTPRRRGGAPARADDPPGLQAAVDRATAGGREGWNDWASYRVLTLRGGQEVRGVFPYKDVDGPRKHEFWTLDGELMVIDPSRDLASGCDAARPGASCDRVVYQVSFPPLPALLLMPAVAVWGYDTNDVWFTLVFAALSAVLLWYWLARLRRDGLIAHSRSDRLWLVTLFAFSTVHWFCAIRGAVWFTALIVGVTLHFAALMASEGARRPLLAGTLLGLGVATRTPLLFGALFLPLEALFPDGRWLGGRGAAGLRHAAGRIALFALPLALIGAALAWFNWARWHNPTEFGHFYLLEGTRAPTRDHGLFSFHFLNHNLATALTNLPKLIAHAPYVQVSRHGLGLLACTPALFAVWCAARPDAAVAAEGSAEAPALVARRRALSRHLLATIAAIAAPALLYQNDGWQQFGYRFALDFWPALIALVALRLPRLGRGTKALIVVGILIQLFGAITFGRLEHFYYD